MSTEPKAPSEPPKPDEKAAENPDEKAAEKLDSHHAGDDPVESASEFGAFVLSLATSALMHMGEVQEGELLGDKEPIKVDFVLAKQSIDLIGMLHHKTRGNLSTEEARLVETVLYDLRLRFLKAQGKTAS